jgi:hypothetical protein
MTRVRCWVVLAAAIATGLIWSWDSRSRAADGVDERPKPRLPEHYAAVVDEVQRQTIYGIQNKYAPQIEKLQAQLNAVMGKRNAEIRAVLTPQQQQKVDELSEADKKKGTAKPDDNGTITQKMIDGIDLKGLEKDSPKKGK